MIPGVETEHRGGRGRRGMPRQKVDAEVDGR